MKIQTTRQQLLPALQKIGGVVERRQTLPILANVLISAKKEGLTITATDLEVELRTKAAVTCDGESEFTMPARKLIDICKALPEEAEISIEIEGDRSVIRSKRSRFTLGVLPAQDYPVIDSSATTLSFDVKEKVLKRLIEKTHFAMAQQDVRYYLNGMLVEARDNKIRSVATDGHRLALCEAEVDLPEQIETQVILPRKAVLELSRLLRDSSQSVRVELTPNHLRLLFDDTVFTTKLIDGRFPDYKRVIPDNNKVMTADKERLKQALARASILSNEKYRGIRFKLEGDVLTLQAHNPEQEEAEEQVDVSYNENEISIGFNVGYLLDVLGAISDDTIVVALNDSNSSAVIRGQETEDSEYVVMPMRL